MATSQVSEFIHHLRRVIVQQDGAGLTDGQLLNDYLSRRDEAALAVLVRRHAPMVWGVCRRTLCNYHDAEDAFQATFLVLVRKAASIMPREMVGNWLYGVAHQTAVKARATAARRKGRERQVARMPEPAVADQDLWRDLQPLLDQELSHLPDKYRAVIVLCDLEGKTRKEAARQLGVPEGTVAGQLARARTMLAKRMARHGLVVSGGALAALLTEKVASAGVPTSMVSSTIKAVTVVAAGRAAASGVFSGTVAALAEGVLKAMLLNKLKITTAVLLFLVAALVGGARLLYQTQAAEPPRAGKKQATATQGSKNDRQPKTAGTSKGGRIFFVRQKVVGQEGFAMVNPDGKEETSLKGAGFFHAVSPDGKKVAYGVPVQGEEDSSNEVVYLKAVGDDKPGESLKVQAHCWCWSPDGQSLAITTCQGNAFACEIFDLKTKNRKPLKPPEVKAVENAEGPVGHYVTDWSKDGKWLLTTARRGDVPADVYRVKSDGSDAKRIGVGADGQFSPDGKKILYLGLKDDDAPDKARLFIADVDGGKSRPVSQELNGKFNGGFCWSPDGKKIAYVWQRDRDAEDQEWETFLMVMDADGKNATVVVSEKLPPTDGYGVFFNPQWR